MSMIPFILIPVAYLLGSIPTGVLVAKAFGGVDPRTSGSRNIGATNVGRSAGKAAGILTLAGDCVKGVLPAYLAVLLAHDIAIVSLVGFAAFIGHLFPVFLGFKGGKGVATACGVMLALSPFALSLSFTVFIAVVLVKRYVSLASMAASAMLPVFLSFSPRGRVYVPLAVMIAALVIIKHKDNIRRLVAGKENRLF